MILSVQNVCKSFGTDEILKNVSFHIEDHEKVAVVGVNGAGKSTLLKIIAGELAPDGGDTFLAKGKTIGYLAQHQDMSGDRSIEQELFSTKSGILAMEKQLREMEERMRSVDGQALERLMESYSRLGHQFEMEGGYGYRSEIYGALHGLGFAKEDYQKKIDQLSGGQKTRAALAKLLVSHPDIIMLDEPTNHLDMQSIAWLESYLMNYKGAVLLVSHDRYFLDRVVTKVVEISAHKAVAYEGNYSVFTKKRAQVLDAQKKAYEEQQKEIKRQEEVIAKLKSFNREKSIKRAESREKMLSKMERLEKPVEERTQVGLSLEPNIQSGNDVLSVEGLAKSYGENRLFWNLSFEIKRGEHVALIGDNGTGKTTIFKILNGLVAPEAGTVRLGTNVYIGYYDQEQQLLHMDHTVLEEISDAYPELTHTQVRNTLAAFLFTEDDVFKRIGDLSGGERGRVSLAKLMLGKANFLILDEPTNHLDIFSKDILEAALNRYAGTVFFISHDRYFINQAAHRILELSDHGLTEYLGNYDYYLEKKGESRQDGQPDDSKKGDGPKAASENKLDWQRQKKEQARLRKAASELKRIEDEIERLEQRIAQIDQMCQDPKVATNSAKLNELSVERGECGELLESLYEKWEALSEECQ